MNIRFLWEFEEEIGSPNFEKIIKKAAGDLRTESVVVSDTVWVSRNRPASSAGLRGLTGFLLTLETEQPTLTPVKSAAPRATRSRN